MSDNGVTIRSIDVGMLKGQINGVTLKVGTGFTDGVHTISYYLDTRKHGDNEIKIQQHKHPWGDTVKSSTCEPQAYADDIIAARGAASDELQRRNLDDPEEWHE